MMRIERFITFLYKFQIWSASRLFSVHGIVFYFMLFLKISLNTVCSVTRCVIVLKLASSGNQFSFDGRQIIQHFNANMYIEGWGNDRYLSCLFFNWHIINDLVILLYSSVIISTCFIRSRLDTSSRHHWLSRYRFLIHHWISLSSNYTHARIFSLYSILNSCCSICVLVLLFDWLY